MASFPSILYGSCHILVRPYCVCLCTYQCVCLSVLVSAYRFIPLYACLSMFRSVCLYVYMCVFVGLCLCRSVCLAVRLCICRSVCVCLVNVCLQRHASLFLSLPPSLSSSARAFVLVNVFICFLQHRYMSVCLCACLCACLSV